MSKQPFTYYTDQMSEMLPGGVRPASVVEGKTSGSVHGLRDSAERAN